MSPLIDPGLFYVVFPPTPRTPHTAMRHSVEHCTQHFTPSALPLACVVPPCHEHGCHTTPPPPHNDCQHTFLSFFSPLLSQLQRVALMGVVTGQAGGRPPCSEGSISLMGIDQTSALEQQQDMPTSQLIIR